MNKHLHPDAIAALFIPALQDIAPINTVRLTNMDNAEAIADKIAALRNLEPADVVMILKALELAEDGACSVSLQQAREDAESQARVNV